MTELKQLQDGAIPGRPVIEPMKYSDLTEDDKRKHALEAVTVRSNRKDVGR